MANNNRYSHLTTDKERRDAIPTISIYDWDVVADWEEETTNEEYRKIFHNASRSMYHRMELREGAL